MREAKRAYDSTYSHILEPITLPNGVVLKNRIISSNSTPYFSTTRFQEYPNEEVFQTMVNRAKGGAALTMLNYIKEENYEANYVAHGNPDLFFTKIGKMYYQTVDWTPKLDLLNKAYHVKYVEMTEAIHMYQSKILQELVMYVPQGWDVSGGKSQSVSIFDHDAAESEELTKEMLDAEMDKWIEFAIAAWHCGFDGINLHMFNEISLTGKMLSERTNHRTDEYGGSMENRTRWLRDFCAKIKKICGRNFIIHCSMNTPDPRPGGLKLEDLVEFGKCCEGLVDIISFRHWDTDYSMISMYEPENKYPTLDDSLEVKKAFEEAGINMVISSIGGYCDPEVVEKALSEDRFDMVEIGRAIIANPNYGRLIREGRSDDIIPCLRCNKCHHRAVISPVWAINECSVNPEWGFEHSIDRVIPKVDGKRNVGIIGGGPAGMRAAVYAADRGHDVTIYEKSNRLGGLLKCLDDVDFKWLLTEYKEWLIRQVEKRDNIRVLLNTEATTDLLKEQGHDAVLAAPGGKQKMVPIPGLESATPCVDIMMDKTREVGKKVVIVGGGDIGVDCGIWLARTGHEVFVLEMASYLAAGSLIMHSYTHKVDVWEAEPNFDYATEAAVQKIEEHAVEYKDKDGNLCTAEADTVLFSVGMVPTQSEAMKLYTDASAYEIFFIGDCKNPASLAEHNRDALGAAALI